MENGLSPKEQVELMLQKARSLEQNKKQVEERIWRKKKKNMPLKSKIEQLKHDQSNHVLRKERKEA